MNYDASIEELKIPVFGEAYTLIGTSLIVLDEELRIIYMNQFCLDLLNIKQPSIGTSFLAFWDTLNLSPLLNAKREFLPNNIIQIKKSFRKWYNKKIQVDKHAYYFLIDEDVSELQNIKDTIRNECKKITGYPFNDKTTVVDYIDEIYHYLTNIINKIPCYIYWKNTHLEYIGCNQLAADFVNLNLPKDIIGKTDLDIFSNHDLAKSYQKTDLEIIRTGQSVINEPGQLINQKSEMLHTLVSKVPLTDVSGQTIGLVGITVDVTELTKAKEAAESANRAKTSFLANMSHDIRTPLTGVIGLSEMLESALAEPEQKENAHLLHDSGEELLNMLNDILDDVRADHMNEDDLQEESFDLYECLDDLVKLELPTTKVKNLDLKLDIASDVPQFLISDRKKIQRILLNLVGNAIKFTQSGQITIEVTCLDSKKSRVHLQFGVADTGIGIPEELQAQVFDRFFRVTSSYKGLYQGHGLGLHIAQSYVSLLGGHITLTSEEGVGSTFYFDLSCKLGRKEATQRQDGLLLKPIQSVPELKPVTQALLSEDCPYLLLVEDNPTALKILENLCVKNQCRFASVQNGEDALELAKSNIFDLIITDIGLPGISGIELTQAIREYEKSGSHSSVPILGLTAHALSEAAMPCIDAGMNKVFQKPMKPDMMELIIDVFLKSNNHQDKRPALQQQASSGLGIDLPATEAELFLLDNFSLLDLEEGIKCLGSETLLQELLTQMAEVDIPADLQTIQNAFDAQNWEQVEKIAHKMKGGAVYCGTIRLKLACQYLERYYKAGHRNQLPALFSQLLAVAQDTIDSINQAAL